MAIGLLATLIGVAAMLTSTCVPGISLVESVQIYFIMTFSSLTLAVALMTVTPQGDADIS